jgi:hypothetical protein
MLSGTSDLEIGILKFSSEDTEATLAVPHYNIIQFYRRINSVGESNAIRR